MKYKYTVREVLIKWLGSGEINSDGAGRMLQEKVEKQWKPRPDEEFYYPDPTIQGLYLSATWTNGSEWRELLLKRGLVFKTKEEAIEKAKKMLEVIKPQ